MSDAEQALLVYVTSAPHASANFIQVSKVRCARVLPMDILAVNVCTEAAVPWLIYDGNFKECVDNVRVWRGVDCARFDWAAGVWCSHTALSSSYSDGAAGLHAVERFQERLLGCDWLANTVVLRMASRPVSR